MVRPANTIPTIQCTWMIYKEDALEVRNSGKRPKDIFRLGLEAYRKGWSPFIESSELQDTKARLRNISALLHTYIEKFNKLCHIVEDGLKINIDPDVVKTSELTNRLKQIHKREAQIKAFDTPKDKEEEKNSS